VQAPPICSAGIKNCRTNPSGAIREGPSHRFAAHFLSPAEQIAGIRSAEITDLRRKSVAVAGEQPAL
jgi:hypothetical protein